MKVRDLYIRALALLNEDEDRNRKNEKNALMLINILLAQCIDTENSVREAGGAEILDEPQTVCSFNDEMIYDKRFVVSAMPYGLASLLCADDDKVMSNAMAREFERIKRKYSTAVFADIANAYA